MRSAARLRSASLTAGPAGFAPCCSRPCIIGLSARRAERLHALARDLAARHSVTAHVIVDDLADPSAPQRLVTELSMRALHVDLLVNNAGYGVPGSYRSTRWQQ